jgi:hypothetical protein
VQPSKRLVFARFLVSLSVVYAGLAIYFAAGGLYRAAIGTCLTAVIGLLVARAITSMNKGGPSLLLAGAFLAALIGVNVVVWTSVR